jgi:hypothetical protein
MHYVPSLSNLTFAYYNVSTTLKNYNDNIMKFQISYINNNSISLSATTTFGFDYSFFIKDDLNPTITNISSPTSVVVNQEILLSFSTSDDRGIKKVTVEYKYQLSTFWLSLTQLSNTSNGANSYVFYYSYTPQDAKSIDFKITVTDTHDQVSVQSKTVVVSDYNAPKVKDYSVTPTDIYVDNEVTITITFFKESETITSVSLTINGKGAYAFEKLSEDNSTETWQLTLKATEAGTFTYRITALNTANKNTQVDLSVTVKPKQKSLVTASPGYELFVVVFGLLALVPITRKLRKQS